MPNIPQQTYSNVPAYPKSWYWQNTNRITHGYNLNLIGE